MCNIIRSPEFLIYNLVSKNANLEYNLVSRAKYHEYYDYIVTHVEVLARCQREPQLPLLTDLILETLCRPEA